MNFMIPNKLLYNHNSIQLSLCFLTSSDTIRSSNSSPLSSSSGESSSFVIFDPSPSCVMTVTVFRCFPKRLATTACKDESVRSLAWFSSSYSYMVDWIPYNQKFLLDKNFTKPRYLCIAEIFHGINFCQYGKGHILSVIINTGQNIHG